MSEALCAVAAFHGNCWLLVPVLRWPSTTNVALETPPPVKNRTLNVNEAAFWPGG